jgi:hypothetical protein
MNVYVKGKVSLRFIKYEFSVSAEAYVCEIYCHKYSLNRLS